MRSSEAAEDLLAETGLERLVSPRAFEQMETSLSQLPDPVWVGFECYLADQAPRADSLLSFGAPQGGPTGRLRFRALALGGPTDPSWRRLQQFDALWGDPASAVYQGVSALWLEFDVSTQEAAASVPPVPNVFFDLVRAADVYRTAIQGIEALQGEPVPADTARTLARCLAALPPGARATFAAVMLARRSDTLRLCVADVPSAAVRPYLERIGWRDPAGGLPELLEPLASCLGDGKIVLQLGIGGGVAPRLGLECSSRKSRDLPPGDWGPLLDYLVHTGLCVPAKRAALGSSQAYVYYERPEPGIYRWALSHVKVAYEAGAAEAKAYFYFRRVQPFADALWRPGS
jgi:hypothetical protein